MSQKSPSQVAITNVYAYAKLTDKATGEWVYGRRAIAKMVPDVSEWTIRKILEEVRGTSIEATKVPVLGSSIASSLEEEVEHPQIIVKLPRLERARPQSTGNQTWVIGSDFHAPYEDVRATSIFYQITNYVSPNRVTLLGDILNLDAFSRYDKIPGGAERWLGDVSAAGVILGNTRQAAPDADLEWVEGNHEERLKKHLMRHDPLLYGILDLEKLFLLAGEEESLKQWKYIEESEIYESDLNLIVAHGNMVRKNAAYTAKAHLDQLLISVIIGHSHRLGIHHRSSGRSRYTGEPEMFAVENGCLCRYDQDYVGGRTADWQHGFTVLDVDYSGDKPYVVPTIVKIDGNKAIFRGKTFTA